MLKLIGVDSSFKAPSMLEQPVINASDFRGEAFGVLARANQASLEAQKNRIINQSSTDLAMTQRQQQLSSGSSSSSYSGEDGGSYSRGGTGRGGGKDFDPKMDVSEREKWEFEKKKQQAELALSQAKFKQDAGLDERKFKLDVSKFDEANRDDKRDFERNVFEDERDFNYKAVKNELEYVTGREDEMFDRGMETAKFDYTKQKDTTERNDKLYEKAKSEFQAQQFALAQQDVQELVLASEGLMRRGGGLEAIRGGLSQIFRKYPGIAPEKQAEIVQGVYATPQRVNRGQIEKTEAKIEEVQQFQRNTVLQAKRLEVQSLTAGLKTATGSSRQNLLKRLNSKLGEFAATDTDPLTKAMVMSNLYKEIADKGEVGADVQQKLLDYANYTKDASKLWMMRNKLSPTQYSLQEQMLATKYGVTGFRVDNTNFDNKVAMETLRTTTDLKELRTKNALDQKFGMNANKAAIAQLAKANATPAKQAALEATAQRYGNPPGLVEAAKVAKDMIAHREKTVEVQSKISILEKEAAMIQASDAQTVLNMIEGGESSNVKDLITTAMLANANPKLAEALQSGKKIPPEVRAEIQRTWKQQRQRIVNEINIQKRLVETQHSMERDYLESYFDKDNFAALDAVRSQVPQLRAGLNGQQVGVSRNSQTATTNAAATAVTSAMLGGGQRQPSQIPQAPKTPQNPGDWAQEQLKRMNSTR